nr:transglutaminase-like domain-containing protein [Tissierella sp.]
MDKTYNKKQKFLLNLIYLAIIFTLARLIGDVIDLELNFLSQLFIVIIIATIIKYFVEYPLAFILTLVLGFLVLLLIDYFKFPIFLSIADRSSNLVSNLISNLQSRENILYENLSLIFLLLVASISTYTSIIIYRSKNIFLLIPIYLAVFLSYWYSFIDKSYNFTAIFLFLFLILLGLKGYKESRFKSDEIFLRWLKTTIFYSLVIVLGAFFIPKSNDYIEFPWLQEKVYNTFPIIEDLRYYKDYNRKTANAELFNFSSSGSEFSDITSDLGGPLVQTEKKVMKVESKRPIYLRGNVKHIYTGRSWEKASGSLEEYSLRQDFSMLYTNEQRDLYTREQASIIFDSFISKTIFSPYLPMSLYSNRDFAVFKDRDDIVTTRDGIYKDEGYLIEYLKPLIYEDLLALGINKSKYDLLDLNIYLQVPENRISDRTRDLSSSLVEGLETDYEKAIKIQEHLRENYQYSLDIDLLPGGEEFVDYFLFEEQRGYCTSYATSMAIMLRLEGIPTRYIEGYIATEEINPGEYQVRQKHAHTWVEAFIEPVGWMDFEPTAAYQVLDNEEPLPDEPEISPDLEEDILPEKDDFIPEESPEIETPFEDEATPSGNLDDSSDNLWKTIRISLALIFLLFIILRILSRYLKYKSKEKHLNKLANREKVVYLYQDILDILSILDFPLRAGETHFEHASRVSYKFSNLKEYGIKDIANIFVKSKYSNLEIKDQDVDSVVLYKDELDKRLKNTIGKSNYFYRKYINIFLKKKNKEIP